MMKAVQIAAFGGPEVCKLAEVPKPTVGAGQVLIKTKFAGVNPVDILIRDGNFGLRTFPFTPGTDCSGVVEAVGDNVDLFKVGDPVLTVGTVTGATAQYTVADVKETFALNPNCLTYEQGACIGIPYFTAYKALVCKAKVKSGESLLVHGASGGVGTICVQFAKHLGMKVFATAGTDKGLAIAKDSGADFTYNHRQSGYADKILADTDGKGVDVVIEMLANVNLQKDLNLLATNGRIVIVGSRGKSEIDPMSTIAKEAVIYGCMIFMTTPAEWEEMRKALTEHQKEGWLKPVVSAAKQYTLENVPEAHQDIMSSAGANGNLVIKTE